MNIDSLVNLPCPNCHCIVTVSLRAFPLVPFVCGSCGSLGQHVVGGRARLTPKPPKEEKDAGSHLHHNL